MSACRWLRTADRLTDSSRGEVVQVGDEFVWVLDFDSVSVENLFGKIFGVVCDDDPGL